MSGASEATTQRRTWLGLGRLCTLFRLNSGKGWISSLGPKGVHRLRDGSLHIEAPRPIALGFGMVNGDPVVGAADLNGWTTMTVTPDMVGQRIAVYTSFEAKREVGGRTSTAQKNWLNQVRSAGGIAGVVRSADDGKTIISDWNRGNLSLL